MSRFINQYTITLELLSQWARHPITQKAINARRKGLILRIAGCIISIVIIFGGILTDDMIILAFGSLFLALFLYRLFILPNHVLKKQFEQSVRMIGSGEWIRTLTFGNCINVEDGRSTLHFDYSEIKIINEDDEYIYLLTGTEVAIRVRKDSFSLGTCSDFRKFIHSIEIKSTENNVIEAGNE